jgi:quaternary ammonium compound-resistance protein SugE
MAWVYVILAGIIEVAWAVGLKASAGFTRPGISALTILGMLASFLLLAQGMKSLPVGTAYAVWTGIGALGTVVIGILYFGESRDGMRLLFIGLILVGILGLKFFSKEAG